MFFIDKYKRRPKAEERIVELLINLRYYYEFWQRAKIFARNLELIYMEPAAGVIKQRVKERSDSSDEDGYGDPKVFD